MPISHLGILVPDINKARDFYTAALTPLGYKQRISHRNGKELGFGVSQAPDFWLAEVKTEENIAGEVGPSASEHIHFAFRASNREQVRQFHKAAIAAGGKDNGGPGLRPQYFKWYYAAFVYDIEGRNIEAVCLKPGFLAERWEVAEWSVVGIVLSAVAAGGAIWFGLI